MCDRAGSDRVRDVFCQATPPAITGLRELQDVLGIDPEQQGYRAPAIGKPAVLGEQVQVSFAIALGHSTALDGHLVSPINPRLFLLTQDVVMAFQRGVQRVELVARARDHDGFNFYLVSFEQACNAADGGCSPGALYTPRVENDWLSATLRDDEDLKNTPLDCRQCHARGAQQPRLLMREVDNPWTHFFLPLPEPAPANTQPGVSGLDLTRDYLAAKADERYAGASNDVMKRTPVQVLAGLAGEDQPLLFDAPTIQREQWPNGPIVEQSAPLPSPTWERGYEAFKRGEVLALPYVEQRATDLDKQATLSDAYTRFRGGQLQEDALPELSDIYPDDPMLRARIGLQTEPDSEPAAALIQACGSCHNDVLDQTVSRARFNIDLAKIERRELALAAQRIALPASSPLVMPPEGARQLDTATRERLLAYLREPARASEPDPALQRAAALGMAGRVEP